MEPDPPRNPDPAGPTGSEGESPPPPAAAEEGEPERHDDLRALARLLDDGGKTRPRDEAVTPPPAPSAAPRPTPSPPPPPPVPELPDDAVAEDAPPAKLVARRYEILRPLGEGKHGRVYLVRDHANQGREMALKILLASATAAKDFAPRLREHLERLGGLNHETINRPRDAGRTELGLFYLSSDRVRGESLRDLLDRKGALRPRHALEIARQLLGVLEHLHRTELVHGALSPENVFLRDRVPWTRENPYGVGVRLVDVGLTSLFDGEAAEAKEHSERAAQDLVDCAAILVELLLGTRPVRLRTDWEGSGSAPATALLSRTTRRVLDRALGVGGARGFATATEFRHAIEAAPEWMPERARQRQFALLVAALVAVSALAIAAWLRGEDVPVTASDGHEAATGATEATEDLRKRLESAYREGEAATKELQGSIDSLTGELEGQRSETERWRGAARDAESERGTLAAGLARAAEERELLEAQLQSSRAFARELETTRLALLRTGDPAFVISAAFDRILDAAEAGEGIEARAILLGLDADEILGGERPAGRELLDAFTAAAASRERAARIEDPLDAAATLAEAREHASGARDRRRGFAALADRWLGKPGADGTTPNRLGRLDRALGEQKLGLAEHAAELNATLEARWEEAIGGNPDRAPDELLAIARWFDDDRLEGYLDRFARHVRSVSENDGELSLGGLRRIDHLDAWATVAASETDLAAGPAGREIALFRFVRRWYDSDEPLDAIPVLDPDGSPPTGWRARFALQARLLGSDSPLLPPPGTRALYRSITPEGGVSWQLEEYAEDPEPLADATRSRVVRQRFFDALGNEKSERTFRVGTRGRRFFEEDLRRRELLDLSRLDPDLDVGTWAPSLTIDLPESLPVRPERVVAFRKRLSEDPPGACLRRRRGARTTWFDPAFGLVRQEDPERITRELIYLEPPE